MARPPYFKRAPLGVQKELGTWRNVFQTQVSKRTGAYLLKVRDCSVACAAPPPEGERDARRASASSVAARVQRWGLPPLLSILTEARAVWSIRRCDRFKESAETDTKSRPQMRQNPSSVTEVTYRLSGAIERSWSPKPQLPGSAHPVPEGWVCRGVAAAYVPSNITEVALKRRERRRRVLVESHHPDRSPGVYLAKRAIRSTLGAAALCRAYHLLHPSKEPPKRRQS